MPVLLHSRSGCVVHPLDSARAKLRRADEHLDTLKAEAAAWLDSEPYDFYWLDPDPNAVTAHLELEIQVGVVNQPPEALSVIFGDTLHNLRGPLDHIFWELVRRTGEPTWEETRTISFPIAKKYATFMDRPGIKSFRKRPSGQPRATWQIDPPGRNRLRYHDRLAIQRHQPYRRSDPVTHPLAVLRDLNDRDKHQAFHPVIVSAEEPGPRFSSDNAEIIAADWLPNEPLEEDAHIATLWLGKRGIDLDLNVEFFPVAIAFGSSTTSIRLRDLDLIRDEVAAVLAEFIWAFPATTL